MGIFRERIQIPVSDEMIELASGDARTAWDVEHEALDMVRRAFKSGDERKIKSAMTIHGRATQVWTARSLMLGVLQNNKKEN